MKITDILKNEGYMLSFEVFPPKTDTAFESVKNACEEIAKLSPSFMSVTYGAGGGTSEYTALIASRLLEKGVTPIAHLTCISSTKSRIHELLCDLKNRGIENILALRGDIPQGMTIENPEYKYASELTSEIRDFGSFCIGGACYPESHPESPDGKSDIESLKIKVDSGCEFLTTQMFFDNDILYNFMYRLMKAGVNIPVIAGIMPVTNAKQIKRIMSISQNALPQRFVRLVDRYGDNPVAMRQAGIAYATQQIIDLYANGVNAVHVYSMNNPIVAKSIKDNLSEIIK
jgi:methylenetetrahydrofolate reductase (NADPH)